MKYIAEPIKGNANGPGILLACRYHFRLLQRNWKYQAKKVQNKPTSRTSKVTHDGFESILDSFIGDILSFIM